MPELPEVEIIRRGLEKKLINHTIQSVQRHRINLRQSIPITLETCLANTRIVKFNRRGKYILMELNNGLTVLFHLGMSGKIIVQPSGSGYEKQKHEHLTILTHEGECLQFIDPRRFGIIDLFPTNTIHNLLKMMGPEPLPDTGINVSSHQAILCDYLHEKFKPKKQSIKNTMLDQRVIAGLGNIYVCESLFLAGISPFQSACELKRQEILLLIQSIQSILLKAIEAGGSSMRDYVHSNGEKGYFQMQWNVYGKEGELCNYCLQKGRKTVIKRAVQAGRSSFYCEICQK